MEPPVSSLPELVARKRQLTAWSCTLQTLFFSAFLLSPPSVARRTHIKQLSGGIEVNFCWPAALSGGSVVLNHQQTAPFGPVGRLIQKRPAEESTGLPATLSPEETGEGEITGLPLLADRQTARVTDFRPLRILVTSEHKFVFCAAFFDSVWNTAKC